jgi:predicted kinase
MPKAYILVGVPASGKSTWAKTYEGDTNIAFISTDKLVDAYARSVNLSYNQVFKDFMPFAVKMMAADVVKAREAGLDIIWDQTSTTVNSRKKKFNMLPGYEMIAVVFKTPESEELRRRLNSRPGKNIPDYVVESMIDGWEEPSEEEGFDKIIYIS